MGSRRRTLNLIAMPAGERQAPGWFALHPGQFESEAERHAAHGRWHCLASSNGRVYRALDFRDELPHEGIALDWAARSILEGDRRSEVAESETLQLELRKVGLIEYPRCLFQHPSPVVRLVAGSLAAGLAAMIIGAAWFSMRWTLPVTDPLLAPTASIPVVAEAIEATTLIQQLAGEWQAVDERLLIKNDKGVIEVLRETRLEDGNFRLDQFAGAPLRFDSVQRRLFLEMPDGVWQLALLPSARRAQLSITYPDKQNVLYQ